MTDSDRKILASRLRDGWPRCRKCSAFIPFARLESIVTADTCVEHSTEGRYIGVPIYGHKTAPEVGKVKADTSAEDGLGESVRQLMRGYHRGR